MKCINCGKKIEDSDVKWLVNADTDGKVVCCSDGCNMYYRALLETGGNKYLFASNLRKHHSSWIKKMPLTEWDKAQLKETEHPKQSKIKQIMNILLNRE